MKNINKHQATIIALTCTLFINTMSIGLVIPVFAPLFTNIHSGLLAVTVDAKTRNLLFSMLVVVPMLAMLFGSPILGNMSDYMGRKKILLMGLTGISVSFILSVVALMMHNVVLLFVSRILAGFMDGTESIAQAAIADISTPAEKMKNMSMIAMGSIGGFVFGPIIGGFLSDSHLVSWFTYATPFWVAALLTLLNIGSLFYLFKETNSDHKKSGIKILQSLRDLVFGFVDKRIYLLSIVYMMIQFIWGVYFQGVSLHLVNRFHYTSSQIGVFMTFLSCIFGFSLSVLVRMLSKRFSPKSITIIALVILSVGLIPKLLLHDQLWVEWFTVIPLAMGVALSYNAMLALFSNAVSPSEQGRVMGTTVSLMCIGWVAAGGFVGSFANEHSNITYGTLIAVAVVGLVVMSRFKTTQKE